MCYHALNQYETAIDNFSDAIYREPKNVEFLKNRA